MSEASSSPMEIRRLWPSDKEAFRDHLLSLDPRSRHLRFGGGMSDDFLIRYAENCFGKGDLIYGAFMDGKMVGAAELRSNQAIWSEQAPSGRHIHAEAALSVDDGYRRRGIGEKLFKRILRAATNHGVEQQYDESKHRAQRRIAGSPARPELRADRRRNWSLRLRRRTIVRQRNRPPPHASFRLHAGSRRRRQHRRGNLPAGEGLRHDGHRSRSPLPRSAWRRSRSLADRTAFRLAGPKRFRRHCGPAYARDLQAVPSRQVRGDEADGVFHQHRPRSDRRAGRPGRRSAGRPYCRSGARCLRDRAASR